MPARATIALLVPLVVLSISSWGVSAGSPRTVGDIPASVRDDFGADGLAEVLVTVRYDDILRATPAPLSERARIQSQAAALFSMRIDSVLAAASPGVQVLDRYENVGVFYARITRQRALDVLAGRTDVVGITTPFVDQHHTNQSLPLIRQPQVESSGFTGHGVSVAVLDTGVDYTLPIFGSCTDAGEPGCRVVHAQDFTPTDDDQLDAHGHGTNVAAIVAAVAPGAGILGLDVFDGSGSFVVDQVDALNFVVEQAATYNVRAVNMSLGGSQAFTSESDCAFAPWADDGIDPRVGAFAALRANSVLPVISSGNDAYVDGIPGQEIFQSGIARPACLAGAHAVGAVYDQDLGGPSWGQPPNNCSDFTTAPDQITCFSMSHPVLLDALAPGARIAAGGWIMSGTSQAAPHVAGAAAVLAAITPGNPTLSDVESALTNTGPEITDPRNEAVKHRLNLVSAVEAVVGPSNTAIGFPVEGSAVNAAAWASGCNPVGICGSAFGPLGVTSVEVAVRQGSDGPFWDGAAFVSPGQVLQAATGAGSWHYAMTRPPDGSYLVEVLVTPQTGDSEITESSFTVDTVPPPAPFIELAAASDTGSDKADNRTWRRTPTFTGTAEPHALVIVTAGSEVISPGGLAAGPDGLWSFTVEAMMDFASHQVSARAMDAAGNRSLASPLQGGGTLDIAPACLGEPATIFTAPFDGTVGDDVISGTPGNDVIDGRAGNDLICGRGGNDFIVGGPGSDIIDGGPGIDTASFFYPGARGVNVNLAGQAPQSRGQGLDTLIGIENVRGSPRADKIRGNAARNRLEGMAANDQLFGAGGRDVLLGGAGRDILDGGPGPGDICDGGPPHTAPGDIARASCEIKRRIP
ncbi:MAG: S8 family serine peptidase [Dehalococcoidia bacterium]|nr:S8 family serine peptidase [Dehalococcoidia bacterium]